MNSALQTLYHYESFIKEIIKRKNPFIKNKTNEFIDLGINLGRMDNKLDKEEFTIMSYSPLNFYNLFIAKHPTFKVGQQDSIEFIMVFLNDIS